MIRTQMQTILQIRQGLQIHTNININAITDWISERDIYHAH